MCLPGVSAQWRGKWSSLPPSSISQHWGLFPVLQPRLLLGDGNCRPQTTHLAITCPSSSHLRPHLGHFPALPAPRTLLSGLWEVPCSPWDSPAPGETWHPVRGRSVRQLTVWTRILAAALTAQQVPYPRCLSLPICYTGIARVPRLTGLIKVKRVQSSAGTRDGPEHRRLTSSPHHQKHNVSAFDSVFSDTPATKHHIS